jgi:hypothetical protein
MNKIMPFKLFAFSMLFIAIACSSEPTNEVPYGENPETPTQQELEEKMPIVYDSLFVTDSTINDKGRVVRLHKINGKRFNGWAKQVFQDNDHRDRYTKIENGIVVWQIGYYANGQLDHDFHMKDGFNVGSQRMWRSNGDPYLDSYYLEGGVPDGIHKRWHADNILARMATFENGDLIYEVNYDQNGNVTRSTGKAPKKNR